MRRKGLDVAHKNAYNKHRLYYSLTTARGWTKHYKETHPCKDCGNFYPAYVMDFDHLRDKINTINNLVRYGSLQMVQIEVEKCEIVCSNCHRIRTYNRKMKDSVQTKQG